MKKKILWFTALLLIGFAVFWFYYNKPAEQAARTGKRNGDGRPLPVQAALAKSGDIDVYIDALGTVMARNTTLVKARVDGQLVRIAFGEGQMVKEGAVLAEIDPRLFQVQLELAKGQLMRDQALLENARLDLSRYQGLLAKDSIARQQVEAQQALVHQYEGVVQTDRAQVDNAQLQLGFTHITAPVSGRLGLRQIDNGNAIHGSDANGLVVITQTRPINVVFAIPADNIAALQARAKETLSVDALDRDGKSKLASGKLLTIDNQIDAATGTVKLKAEFANMDDKLFPNQFVNARLRVETRHNAVLVPIAAIQHGTQGDFVYVVAQDQSVSLRPVTTGPASGDTIAIDKGLAVAEQIVTDGADKLKAGAKVEVTTPGAGKVARGGPGDSGKGSGASSDERQKRWAEMNARIDKGEFGEEIKKLPEAERKQRMKEMRRGGQ
jgi:membrane fusion protein, multidrug efflux system